MIILITFTKSPPLSFIQECRGSDGLDQCSSDCRTAPNSEETTDLESRESNADSHAQDVNCPSRRTPLGTTWKSLMMMSYWGQKLFGGKQTNKPSSKNASNKKGWKRCIIVLKRRWLGRKKGRENLNHQNAIEKQNAFGFPDKWQIRITFLQISGTLFF